MKTPNQRVPARRGWIPVTLLLVIVVVRPVAGQVAAWGNNSSGQCTVPPGASNLVALAGGDSHTLALTETGTILGWGLNTSGQTSVPLEATNAVAIGAGAVSSLALLAGGTVTAWGGNNSGQTNVPASATNIIAVAAGVYHGLALRSDGTVVAWGQGTSGQTNVPPTALDIVGVAAGWNHSLALRSDGTLVVWGANNYGQTNVPWAATNVIAIASGDHHNLGLKADGTLVAWGLNSSGQTNVPAGATNIVSIAACDGESMALRQDGRVFAWGDNTSGRTNVPVSVTNAIGVAAGRAHDLAWPDRGGLRLRQAPLGGTVSAGGDFVFLAGGAGKGPLGYQWSLAGTALAGATNSWLVVRNAQAAQAGDYVVTITSAALSVTSPPATLTVAPSPPAILSGPVSQQVLAWSGVHFSVAARGSEPFSYQWRYNGTALPGATAAGLGLDPVNPAQAGSYDVVVGNAFGAVTSAVAALKVQELVVWGATGMGITNVPAAATNVAAFDAGYYAAVALRADRSLLAWGNASYGLTTIPASATNVIAVSTGYEHALALRGDGTVVAWGDSTSGRTAVPASLANVVAIAAGGTHSLALRGDGTVAAWGSGVATNVPATLADVMAIAADLGYSGTSYSLALRRDGTVAAWGASNYGQTTVPGSATNVVALASGGSHVLALRGDGTLTGWGDNPGNIHVAPTAATNLVAISAGFGYSLALRNDGTLFAWGQNTVGQTNVPTNLVFAGQIGAGPNSPMALAGNPAPRFIDLPGRLTAYVGRDFSLNARAVGRAPLAYQWRCNGQDVPGATQPVLTLANLQFTNGGTYTVVVSNAFGVATGLVAALSVQWPPQPPTFSQQPQSQTVNAGESVVFSVVAAGNPAPALQWRLNGVNLPGATNASYTINHVLTNQAGSYQVNATNVLGTALSLPANLTVTMPPWPLITSWPADQAVSIGAPLTLKAIATAPGPIHYQWLLNGTNLPGVVGPAVTFNAINATDTGVYSVRASNDAGSDLSPGFLVAAVPVSAWGGGVVTVLPTALTNAVALSAGLQFAVALKADGTVVAWGQTNAPAPWQYLGVTGYQGQFEVPAGLRQVVAVAAGGCHVLALKADGTLAAWGSNIAGQTNVPAGATNLIGVAAGNAHSLALRAEGTVLAWGTNSYGQTRVPAEATNVVAIAAHGDHCFALRGDGTLVSWGSGFWAGATLPGAGTNLIAVAPGASFGIALGRDGRRVQWGNYPNYETLGGSFLYGQDPPNLTAIAAGDQHSLALSTNGGVITFVSQPGFPPGTLGSVPAWCSSNIVAVAAGYDFSLALARPAGGLPAPQTMRRAANVGGPVVFAASGAGQRAASCRWRFNGADLTAVEGPFLSLTSVQASQEGDYSVVITDPWGTVTGATAHLAVVLPAVPAITRQPVACTNNAGTTATFTVQAGTGVPVAYQWRCNGADLAGATGSSLTLENVQAGDAGAYTVVLANAGGAVTSTVAVLSVSPSAPVFAVSPVSQAVLAGQPAVLSALARGTDPVHYQWQFNGGDLPGRTEPILRVSPMDASGVGTYHVVASNVWGTATSADAALVLTPAAVWGDARAGQTIIPPAANDAIALAAGAGHVLALRPDGTVLGWGSNSCGQATIPGTANHVVRIAAGDLHSLALRSDNTVLGWGDNLSGQCSPPGDLANVVEIAAGTMHSLALKADGTVAAWGMDWIGSTEVPADLSNVVAIAAGGFHNLALQGGGTVVAWGMITNVPVQATNVVAVAAGLTFNAALRADGTVIAWGAFAPPSGWSFQASCSGYALTGGIINSNPLIAGPPDATNLVAISAGRGHLLGLRSDGTLVAWGDDSLGQTELPPLAGVTAVAAGGGQSLALVLPPAPGLWLMQTDLAAGEGDAVVVNPAAAGARPCSWSWQKDGAEVAGATGRFLYLPAVRPGDAGWYVATVTNLAGRAAAAFALTITSTPPTVTTQPASQIVPPGSNVTFSVSVAGSLPLVYQWRQDGLDLADQPGLSGANTATLTLSNAAAGSAGTYSVQVSNALGVASSAGATLQVLSGPPLVAALDSPDLVWSTGGTRPWQYQSATTHDGVDAAAAGPFAQPQNSWLETVVTGPTALGFWWSCSGNYQDRYSVLLDGIELAAITQTFSQGWQAGSIYVPAGDHTVRWVYAALPATYLTSTAWLDQVGLSSPTAVSITTQPASWNVLTGSNPTFNVSASGTLPLSYQWQFNGVNLDSATTTSLRLTNVQPSQAGSYSVVVSNLCGPVTSGVGTLVVNGAPPVITADPQPSTSARGLTATLAAAVTGTAPLAVQWQRNRAPLPGGTAQVLSLTNAQPADTGWYRLVAGNDFGSAISAEALLTIVPVAAWGSNPAGQTRVPAEAGDVVAVAAGYAHSVALRRDGSLVTWGDSSHLPPDPLNPTAPPPGENLVAIAGGLDHDVGLRADGTLAEWGILGYGLDAVPPGLTKVTAVAAGAFHNLAIGADGSVVAWGLNTAGQTRVPPGTTHIAAVAGGWDHSLALRENGTVLAWGGNDCGQSDVPGDLTNALAIAAGNCFSLALREDGSVAAWGDPSVCGTNLPPGLTDIVAVAAGDYHALALHGDGAVTAWGVDTSGSTVPPTGLNQAVAVAGGHAHSLALIGDGSPVITVQPLSRRFVVGQPARLQVRAVGAPSLACQWQYNGVDIPGGTELNLSLGATAPAGSYSAVVSNALGVVRSQSVLGLSQGVRLVGPPGGLRLDGQGFHFRLTGLSGVGPVVIQTSTNLTSWEAIATNAPVLGTLDFAHAGAALDRARFYRAIEILAP